CGPPSACSGPSTGWTCCWRKSTSSTAITGSPGTCWSCAAWRWWRTGSSGRRCCAARAAGCTTPWTTRSCSTKRGILFCSRPALTTEAQTQAQAPQGILGGGVGGQYHRHREQTAGLAQAYHGEQGTDEGIRLQPCARFRAVTAQHVPALLVKAQPGHRVGMAQTDLPRPDPQAVEPQQQAADQRRQRGHGTLIQGDAAEQRQQYQQCAKPARRLTPEQQGVTWAVHGPVSSSRCVADPGPPVRHAA